jgi:hypothetical protein
MVQTHTGRDIDGENQEGGTRRPGSAGPRRSIRFYTEALGVDLVNDGNRLEIFFQEMTQRAASNSCMTPGKSRTS